MMICSCNVISCGTIKQAVQEMLAEDPGARITTRGVLQHLQCKPDCCNCMPNFGEHVRANVASLLQSDELACPSEGQCLPVARECGNRRPNRLVPDQDFAEAAE